MNKKLKPPFLSTGFNDSKKGARERFSNIFTNNKKRNGLAVFMIIALLGIGASVLVSCRNISAPKAEAEAEVQNGAKTLDNIISEILLWVAVVLTVISGVDYLIKNRSSINTRK